MYTHNYHTLSNALYRQPSVHALMSMDGHGSCSVYLHVHDVRVSYRSSCYIYIYIYIYCIAGNYCWCKFCTGLFAYRTLIRKLITINFLLQAPALYR